MPYPTEVTDPMRQELIDIGVREIRTPEQVDSVLAQDDGTTTMVFVNSVCGCAAKMARPGLATALENAVVPGRMLSVFAGVDLEATARLRSYFPEHPPTSPQVALMRGKKLLQLIQRHEIEGTSREAVATKLVAAFDAHCAGSTASQG